MISICQLCRKEKELIGRSHIWPKFMYAGMYDDKGRLYVLNSEDPTKHHTVQSGSYQQYIFCKECDNVRLGKLERYASNYLYRKPYLQHGEDFKLIDAPGGIHLIECLHLDYSHYKLFLLSLLWRASISTESLFENFKLSGDDEEFLRVCLYEHAVVDEMVFPCVVITSDHANLDENFIAVDANRPGLVKFYINAFVYTFYLAKNKKEKMNQHLAIGMDDPMRIMKVSLENWNQIRESIIEATIAATKNKEL